MFGRIAEFYQRQAQKGEFEIRLSTQATPASIASIGPDAVVVATGCRPRTAQVPGGRETWTVSDALNRDLDGIERLLVVDRAGTMHALMLSDYLSALGIEVEYITPAARAASAIEAMTREEMLARLQDRGVRFSAEQELVSWDERSALVRHSRFVEERALQGIDAVVVSAGAEAVNGLALELSGIVPEVHTIGDANVPRTVQEATLQGGLVGRML